jgi:carbon storage regulator
VLVLSRKFNEQIVIHDPATLAVLGTITIVDIRGDKVRIGFDWPTHVMVDRLEVYQSKRAERGLGP